MSEFDLRPGDRPERAAETPAGDLVADRAAEPAAQGTNEAPTETPAVPAPAVAAALAGLDALGDLELEEHPDVYQRIHTELQSALSAIDDA